MAEEKDFDLMQGRGAPLKGYAVKDDAWPALWRMPDALFDEVDNDETADVADKIALTADDICLRAAINVYDNCARLPGSETGVVAGLMGAMTRFMTPLSLHLTEAEVAAHGAAFGEAIAGQIMRWRDVMANGWEGAAEATLAREAS